MSSHGSRLPRLLVLSHVLPLPGQSGQQQRVAQTLRAVQNRFQVTFATVAPRGAEACLKQQLASLSQEVLVLPSRLRGAGAMSRGLHAIQSRIYALFTGLKPSNYAIGHVEFSPQRVLEAVGSQRFDLVLLEYFHATEAACRLRDLGMPIALDTHNVLWKAYEGQLSRQHRLPELWKRWALARYRAAEESSWQRFNAVIGINREEAAYIKSRVPASVQVIEAGMGIDLAAWPLSRDPAFPPRVAFYGGLGSPHNAREALRCYHEVLPRLWQHFDSLEFWVVGSNPPPEITALAQDARVRVTGFVQRPQELLKTMSVCLCPWTGTYGFRSRLVEVMALGIPVVASPDAVYGMDFVHGEGIFLEPDAESLAERALKLVRHPELAKTQGRAARRAVELHYGFDATYGALAEQLVQLSQRVPDPQPIST